MITNAVRNAKASQNFIIAASIIASALEAIRLILSEPMNMQSTSALYCRYVFTPCTQVEAGLVDNTRSIPFVEKQETQICPKI